MKQAAVVCVLSFMCFFVATQIYANVVYWMPVHHAALMAINEGRLNDAYTAIHLEERISDESANPFWMFTDHCWEVTCPSR